MRSRWTLMFVPALCLGSFAWSAEKVAEKSAEDKAEDAFYANRMVISALEAEVQGDFAARERLLKEAAQTEAAPAAQAHLGMIDVGVKKPDWKTIDESMTAAAKDDNLLRYEKVRRQSPDTADGHLAMARWCLSRKMVDQARAHLSRILDFAPEHPGARNALGFVQVGGRWLSPQEMEKMQMSAQAKSDSINKYAKKIAALIDKLKSKNPKDQEAARTEFLAFKQADAVGAVEAAFATPDPAAAKLLIEWMQQIDTPDSSLVLLRYSLLHPEQGIRDLAIDKLVGRPLHDFVPEMLKMLSSPISSMVMPVYDRQGRLTGYRQAFAREGFGDKDVQVIDKGVQRITPRPYFPGFSARFDARATAQAQQALEADIQQQAAAEVQAREREVQRQNELIKQVNDRIGEVIAKVSGKPKTDDATEMWKWWDDYNETEYQTYKPDRYRRSTSVSTYINPMVYEVRPSPPRPNVTVTRVANPGISSGAGGGGLIPECFVAGTPVITQTGPQAIETILPGDLVLNRDMISGALRWQPVLKRTQRPPGKTLAITVGDSSDKIETYRCSTGHLFWVSGLGWKKASELQPGQILHGAKSPIRITSVEAQPAAQTYNLEVADAPNYFVGQHMILTHDVTPRETNRQAFPGQDLVRQLSEQRPVKKTASR